MTLRVSSLAIGDELLDGRVLDGNSRDLGDALSQLGQELVEARVVPDDRARIIAALKELAAKSDVIVTSGGLGPTSDDITAECIAEAAGVTLRFDEAAFERIVQMFAARNIPMPESNRRQAMLPASSRTLENQMGTAPGFVTPLASAADGAPARTCEVWSFPGVPVEYKHLRDEYLLPAIEGRVKEGKRLVRRTLRSLGLAESAIGEKLAALEKDNPDVRVQYRAAFPEIIVRLVLDSSDTSGADEKRADALQERARTDIGDTIWGLGDEPLERRVFAALSARNETMATAESCTGGLIAKRITDIAGSSAVMLGGVVAYANEVKTALLGVNRTILEEHGAVSEATARAMAEGARTRLGASWAVSTTGVAGPGGGTPEKPVGLVWFGLAGPKGTVAFKKRLPDFGRERVRDMAAAWALRFLLVALTDSAAPGKVAS